MLWAVQFHGERATAGSLKPSKYGASGGTCHRTSGLHDIANGMYYPASMQPTPKRHTLTFTDLELLQVHAVLAIVQDDPDWYDMFQGPQRSALNRAHAKIIAALR